MFSIWHLWVVIAIVLFIGEIFTPNFLLASFGIGCLVSSLAAGLGFGIKSQISGFIGGTLIAFFGVRPVFVRYCYKASSSVRTNVDALIGKTALVSETISDELNSGRVLVGGDDWRAVSLDGCVIQKESLVKVVKVEGVTLYVKLK